MTKLKAIVAAAVVACLLGTIDLAVAGSSDGRHPGNGVTISIRDVAVDPGSNAGQGRNANTDLSQNTSKTSGVNANTNSNGSNAMASAGAGVEVTSESSGGNGGSSNAAVDGDEAAASSAAPIFLDTGDDTCMGSGGLGAQGLDFGVSISSTWRDSNCVTLRNARELKNQGHDKAAKARLCMNEENALAFELSGQPCPRALASTQAAIALIRETDPEYQAAVLPAVQVAALGDVAGASAGPASEEAAESRWLAPQIDSVLAMVMSIFDHTAGGDTADATTMDGLE